MSLPTTHLPANRDENWRYAALRAISKTQWDAPAPMVDAAVLARLKETLPPRLPDSLRLVLFAGRLVAELSDRVDEHPASTLSLMTLVASSIPTSQTELGDIDQRFAAINRQHAAQVLQLRIAASSSAIRLEIICCHAGMSHPAIDITLQDNARAEIIERHLGWDDATGINNLRLTVELGEAAALEHSRVLQPAARSHHIETLAITLSAHAQLLCTQLVLGGASSRSTVFIRHGESSTVDWHVGTLAEGQEVHDSYVRTQHLAPRATTRQLFRGIASGRARVAFNGHMQVDANALQSDLQQSLKCLLDGTAAEGNLRPQLEIYTDAVSASHGATVGKLDRDMLFYLLSRGIEPATAESLLKWAFISDVLARLPNASLRTQVETRLQHRLPGAMAARAEGLRS